MPIKSKSNINDTKSRPGVFIVQVSLIVQFFEQFLLFTEVLNINNVSSYYNYKNN